MLLHLQECHGDLLSRAEPLSSRIMQIFHLKAEPSCVCACQPYFLLLLAVEMNIGAHVYCSSMLP